MWLIFLVHFPEADLCQQIIGQDRLEFHSWWNITPKFKKTRSSSYVQQVSFFLNVLKIGPDMSSGAVVGCKV